MEIVFVLSELQIQKNCFIHERIVVYEITNVKKDPMREMVISNSN